MGQNAFPLWFSTFVRIVVSSVFVPREMLLQRWRHCIFAEFSSLNATPILFNMMLHNDLSTPNASADENVFGSSQNPQLLVRLDMRWTQSNALLAIYATDLPFRKQFAAKLLKCHFMRMYPKHMCFCGRRWKTLWKTWTPLERFPGRR